MSSDGAVRPLIDRLAATILLALLALPSGIAWPAASAGEPEGHAAPKAGMSAPPPPAGPVPVLASAPVVAVSRALSCARPPNRVVSPPRAARSAPAILRI